MAFFKGMPWLKLLVAPCQKNFTSSLYETAGLVAFLLTMPLNAELGTLWWHFTVSVIGS